MVVPVAVGAQQLVAYYPLEGDADDASGSLHHGVVSGATFTDLDTCGYCVFDGENDSIRVGGTPLLRPQHLTLAVCVYLRSMGGASNSDDYIRKQYGAHDASYELLSQENTGKAVFSLNRGSSNPADGHAYSNAPLELDRWYHIAGTYDGVEMKLYVDGVLQDDVVPYPQATYPIHYDDSDVGLGADIAESTHYLDGFLDEVRVYDYALSEARILALAAIGPTDVGDDTWGRVKGLFR